MGKTAIREAANGISLIAMSLGIKKLPRAALSVLVSVIEREIEKVSGVGRGGLNSQGNVHLNVLDVIQSAGGHDKLNGWLDRVEKEEVGMFAEETPIDRTGDVSWGRGEAAEEEEGEEFGSIDDVVGHNFDDVPIPATSSGKKSRPYPSHLPPPHPVTVLKLADVESDMTGLEGFKREVAETWGSGGATKKKKTLLK